MGGDEKLALKQWTVRGISSETIKQVKILSGHYGITNGEVLNRLVGVAYRQREADKLLEAFSDL